MVLVMLIMYAISVPLVVVAFVESTWMGIVVNFFCVQSYWCLNEVARDLEDPFIYDPNDLPLARYQVRRPAVTAFNYMQCESIVNVHITMS
jgi:predicted membrane chloride channel (bestrophin family)